MSVRCVCRSCALLRKILIKKFQKLSSVTKYQVHHAHGDAIFISFQPWHELACLEHERYIESYGIIKFIMLKNECLFGESFVLPFLRVFFFNRKGFAKFGQRYNEWTLSLNRYNIGFDLMYALWIIICANDSHIHSTLQSQQKKNGEQYVSYLCL